MHTSTDRSHHRGVFGFRLALVAFLLLDGAVQIEGRDAHKHHKAAGLPHTANAGVRFADLAEEPTKAKGAEAPKVVEDDEEDGYWESFQEYRRTQVKNYKKFAFRKNVMDVAVGLMIGAALTALVASLTKDVLTPFVSAGLRQTGDVALHQRYWVLANGHQNASFYPYKTIADAETDEAIIVRYGAFMAAAFQFFISTAVIFMFDRFARRLRANHWALNGLKAAEEVQAEQERKAAETGAGKKLEEELGRNATHARMRAMKRARKTAEA